MKKTTLCSAIGLALGTASLSAQANLSTSAVLEFTAGGAGTVSCLLGTPPPCTNTLFNVTDIVGSFFSMDSDGSGTVEVSEKVPLVMLNGIHIGSTQAASGSHTGAPDGSENPNIDNPWLFFSNTGMSQTTSAITGVGGDTTGASGLDFSGWGVTWSGIPNIPMGGDTANFPSDTGIASITCSLASCSDSSTFVLDYNAHVPLGDPSMFGGVPYALHLEGHVANAVPIPAAVWLFGSGLVGLVGVARRRKA